MDGFSIVVEMFNTYMYTKTIKLMNKHCSLASIEERVFLRN